MTNVCYKSSGGGGGGGVHVLMLQGLNKIGINVEAFAVYSLSSGGHTQNDYIFLRHSTLPAAMYGNPVPNHQI